MRRALILLSCAFVAPAATARAGELPAVDAGAHAPATCLRPTGAPGEMLVAAQRRHGGLDRLWAMHVPGPAPEQALHVPGQVGCAAIASNPDASAVFAVLAGRRILVATRPAGGRFGPLREVARTPTLATGLVAAVGPGGDAAVLEQVMREGRSGTHVLLRVVRIRPGAADIVSRVAEITTFDEAPAALAVDGAGRVTVAWTVADGRVATRTADPAAPFGRVTRVPGISDAQAVALAAAPAGRTLVAAGGYGGVVVAEREPGATRFHASDTIRGIDGELAVAMRDDGGAVVAGHDTGTPGAGAGIAWRRPGAGFGAAQEVAPEGPDEGFGSGWGIFLTGGVGDLDPATPRALLGPGGEVVVSWVRGRGGSFADPTEAWLARGTLASASLHAERFGAPTRFAGGSAPVLTADGRPGLAWVDAAPGLELPGLTDLRGPGRLHLALDGVAAAPSAAPPGIRLRVRRRQALYGAQPLPVTVRCTMPCDVLARALGGSAGATLGRAATQLRIRPATVRTVGTHRGRRVIVRAAATAPGGSRASRATATATVRLRPPPAPPVVEDLRARRRGNAIVVTWRTDRPARRVSFNAFAATDRHSPPRHTVASARNTPGRGRLRHRAVIRPNSFTARRDVRRARYIAVLVVPRDPGRDAGAWSAAAPIR